MAAKVRISERKAKGKAFFLLLFRTEVLSMQSKSELVSRMPNFSLTFSHTRSLFPGFFPR